MDVLASVSPAVAQLPETFWTEARYPDPDLNYDPARNIYEQQAREAFDHAEVIVSWVQEQLLAPPPEASTGNS